MTLTINIHLPDDGIADQTLLDKHLAHIGFSRVADGVSVAIDDLPLDALNRQLLASATGQSVDTTDTNDSTAGPQTNTRERGQPSGGRARRTKAEIAEDEAADKADASSETTTQSISTGEERVGPEDDAETQAQDRADEEAEESKDAAPLTVMDGKAAIGVYLGKHGMEAAQADGMAIFTGALGNPPEGKAWGWTMLSELGDQSKIDKAVLAWQAAATAGKRYGAK